MQISLGALSSDLLVLLAVDASNEAVVLGEPRALGRVSVGVMSGRVGGRLMMMVVMDECIEQRQGRGERVTNGG